nr:NnrT protein [Rhodovulum euryhalinum]
MKIAVGLYPLGAGAAAINLFFQSLIGSWVGLPVLSPAQSALGGAVLGLPMALAFARHFDRLIRVAERN